MTTKTLEQTLARLDALLVTRRRAVHATLQPPAGADALERLALALAPHAPLHPDVRTLFRWHDGQSRAVSLSADDNFFMHSIESALDAWGFLTDPSEEHAGAYASTWLPLFENGAGDHRVLDLRSGALRVYDHEAGEGPVLFPDLAGWALAACEALEAAQTPPSIASATSPVTMTWSAPAAPPTEEMVQAAPLGSVYLTSPTKSVQLRIKTDDDTWMKASGRDEALAAAQLHEHLASPPGAESGYWETDWEAWRACKKGGATACGTDRARPPTSEALSSSGGREAAVGAGVDGDRDVRGRVRHFVSSARASFAPRDLRSRAPRSGSVLAVDSGDVALETLPHVRRQRVPALAPPGLGAAALLDGTPPVSL